MAHKEVLTGGAKNFTFKSATLKIESNLRFQFEDCHLYSILIL